MGFHTGYKFSMLQSPLWYTVEITTICDFGSLIDQFKKSAKKPRNRPKIFYCITILAKDQGCGG